MRVGYDLTSVKISGKRYYLQAKPLFFLKKFQFKQILFTKNIRARNCWAAFCPGLRRLGISTLLVLGLLTCQSGPTHAQDTPLPTNHLADESSPYLLQHAHNPVDWYPWKDEALQKARAEDRLLLISIGYAACHWCHVMEEESFADTTVARVMNDHYVSIKVDREERPDVDDVYMTACQLVSEGGCGWPLNVIALPDGRPLWAGTYFPRADWLKIIEQFARLYQTEPDKMRDYAARLTTGIAQSERLLPPTGEPVFGLPQLRERTATLLAQLDPTRGGGRSAPKFPLPQRYAFLLKYQHQQQDSAALAATTTALDQMARGGIYDQLAGGFARYATDADWRVPHFEKMLYDNGQLVSLYAQAYQVTKNPLYARIVRQTLDFVDRRLSAENGGFYSSLDADSEGEEGKFYVWTRSEIDAVLADPELAQLVSDFYQVTRRGNWEGSNILYPTRSSAEFARQKGLAPEDWTHRLAQANQQLLAARNQRVPPRLDDKMLTAWNALMLKGYVDAYRALGDERYLRRALNNAEFISRELLRVDGRLDRNFKDGRAAINAFLDDYAFTIQAFIALYEVTFDERWLHTARRLTDYVLRHFDDPDSELLFYTSALDPPLVARKQSVADNVLPSANSTMARNLLVLGHYFYEAAYPRRAQIMLHTVWPAIAQSEDPTYYANWLALYLDLAGPLYEVAIVGPAYRQKLAELSRSYLPNALLLGGPDEGSLELLAHKLIEGETFIYVCQDKVCQLPVTDPQRALMQLNP